MKRIRIIALALVALFALGAIAATAASAEEGFLALTKKGVTVTGGEAKLETASESVPPIICLKLTGKGTMTTDSHGSGTLDFFNCSALGFPLNSLGDTTADPKEKGFEEGGLYLVEVLFLVCLINSAKLEFGVAIETDKELHLEVPALGVLMALSGRIIGQVLTTGKANAFKIDFAGSKGTGNVKECTFGKEAKKHTWTVETNHNGKPEAASEGVTGGELHFEEVVELMDT